MGNFLLENAHILTGANNTYNIGSSTNKWKNVYATSFIGNASTASKLAAAFTLTLSGAVTGSASIDGSGNVTLNTVVNHTHGTGVSWDNRALTVTAGGTSATASIPATLSGFTSISSTSFVGALSGNASTASKWANARTITFTGDATGSVSLDGSSNVSCALTVGDDSHNHSTSSSWSNRSLTVTAAGTSTTSTIPATLTGFTSISSTTFVGALSGNASTASKWANARTVTFSGDVSGSFSIDGNSNVSCTLAVANDSHNHSTNASWSNRTLTVTAAGTSASATIPTTLTGFTSITSTSFVGNLTGNASNVDVTDTTPTSATSYYLLYSSNRTTGQVVRANADLYYYDTGTTGYLNVGSSAQAGGLTLHEVSSGNFYVNLLADSLTATRTIKLPDQSGTISLTSHSHATSASWSNRTLSIGAGGTSATASIPTTLTGFASISSTTFVGALSGNASTASTWQTSRTVTFSGDVSGSFSINGGANVSCTLTVADDSHNHSTSSSWSNRSLTVTAAGTSTTSTIPATLTGFTSITSSTLIASTKMVIPVKASTYTSTTAGEIWIVA